MSDQKCPGCGIDNTVLVALLKDLRRQIANLKAANETLQDDLARSRHAADKAAIAGYEAEQKLKAANEQLRGLLARCVQANEDGDYYNDVHVWGPAEAAAKEIANA